MTESEKTVPAYIVLDIPSPMAEKIRSLREKFDPPRAAMPVEITLTGSCGLGLISPGQNMDMVCREIDRIAADTAPFEASFFAVERFKMTDIYFLTVRDEAPFFALHRKFAESKIRFEDNRFPYRPHCTLKLRSTPTETELFELLFLNPPAEPFPLTYISVYCLSEDKNGCELLYRAELGRNKKL